MNRPEGTAHAQPGAQYSMTPSDYQNGGGYGRYSAYGADQRPQAQYDFAMSHPSAPSYQLSSSAMSPQFQHDSQQ